MELEAKERVHSAVVSPTGCSLAVLLVSEVVFLKSCDLNHARVKFFPLVAEAEYESVLIDRIKHPLYSSQLLPGLLDIVIHLKLVSSDLVPTQEMLEDENLDNITKSVLVRALFHNDQVRLDQLRQLLQLQAASILVQVFPQGSAVAAAARAFQDNSEARRTVALCQTEEICQVTFVPLSLFSQECECCSAPFNLFDPAEALDFELAKFVERPCPYCSYPRPSTSHNASPSDLVTLEMIEPTPNI